MVTSLEALDPPIRRAKLRVPRLGSGHVPRPRLTARLDQCLQAPLTLVAAPAGFGKTTLLAEWAAGHPLPLAWLTVDANADDRDLNRFVPHVVAAIETVVPGCAAPVLELLQQPQLVNPGEIGAALAEELLDLTDDVILVIDDYQLAASANVERFLGALLQADVPSLHLVLSTRSDPALPLARMRLHGQLIELRAADLRFSEEEALKLLAAMGHGDADMALAAALQQQTGGWIAGMRLAILALPTVEHLARTTDAASSEQHLMDFLVEEVLAAQPAATQDFLLRTAIVDRVCASLADSLLETEPTESSRTVLERLVHDSLFLEPVDDREGWFRYHPLFRTLLRHQLDARFSAEERATLYARASAWYAAQGSLDLAIQHCLAAGDLAGAARLVEDAIHGALDREDWNTVAGWLRLLPESCISRSPALLLAKGWASHFSGRAVPITAMLAELNALLTAVDADPAAVALWEAERDALCIAALLLRDSEPRETVEFARRAVAHVPAHHRLAAGLASFGLGCALQAAGRTDEAIRYLTQVAERGEERIDAGSIRALGGLMFVHRQAGNVRACHEVARHILTLAQRHHLPVATGWAHWMLGWLDYNRNDLQAASEHFTAIIADRQRVHLHTTCEAMFGLALVYSARAMPIEAASTLRRLLEIILDANALEYLPLFRGFEARLALLQGDLRSAVDWLAMADIVDIESTSLDCFDHPLLTRLKVLLAEGSSASLERAWRDLERLRSYAESHHHAAHRIEILALSALVLDAQGQTEAALSALHRSVDLAAASGVLRTYLDLGPALGPLLHRLTRQAPESAYLHRLRDAIDGLRAVDDRSATVAKASAAMPMLELLTVREAEVLACLYRRLSYQEIGEELYISPQTVKSHAANIYGKLGVGNRRQALSKAQAYGWFAPTPPLVAET